MSSVRRGYQFWTINTFPVASKSVTVRHSHSPRYSSVKRAFFHFSLSSAIIPRRSIPFCFHLSISVFRSSWRSFPYRDPAEDVSCCRFEPITRPSQSRLALCRISAIAFGFCERLLDLISRVHVWSFLSNKPYKHHNKQWTRETHFTYDCRDLAAR